MLCQIDLKLYVSNSKALRSWHMRGPNVRYVALRDPSGTAHPTVSIGALHVMLSDPTSNSIHITLCMRTYREFIQDICEFGTQCLQ